MLVTVGMADMRVSAAAEDVMVTHALGSCLGIVIYDPVAKVGGMLHAMLPDSTIDPSKAERNPFTFVDTGVPMLFHGCYAKGASKARLIVRVAGGANSLASPGGDCFQIGKRNFLALRRLLWKNNVLIHAHDVGGSHSRTVSFRLSDGEILIKTNGSSFKL